MELLNIKKNIPKEILFKISMFDPVYAKYFRALKRNYYLANNQYYNQYHIYNTYDGYYDYIKDCFCGFKNKKNCRCGKIYTDNEKIINVQTKPLKYPYFQFIYPFYRYIKLIRFKEWRKYDILENIDNHYHNLKINLLYTINCRL